MTTAARSSSKAKRAKLRKKTNVKALNVKVRKKATQTRKAVAKSTTAETRGKARVAKAGKGRRAKVGKGRVVGARGAKKTHVAESRAAKTTAGAARSQVSAKPRSHDVTARRSKTARKVAGRSAQVANVARRVADGTGDAGQQLKFGFKDEPSELAVLQKEHRKLLLRIARRRALITVSKQASDELMRELTDRVIPYREELFDITREVCDLRDRLLESSGLPASQLEKVRWVLSQILAPLPVEEAEAREFEENEPETDAATSQRADNSRAQPAQDVSSKQSATKERVPPVNSDASSSEPVTRGDQEVRSAAASETAQREAPSAAKPTGDQSGALRTLFKKLAIAYHPDRVQDDTVKAARTKIMKDLTQAFETADLARLVELERTLAAKVTEPQSARETPERQGQQLAQANLELKLQLKDLRAQLKRIKEDCPFTLDLRLRDPARLARDELDQLVLDRHMAVERAAKTREFVAMFAAGRMKVSDFLKGPSHMRRVSEAQLAQFA